MSRIFETEFGNKIEYIRDYRKYHGQSSEKEILATSDDFEKRSTDSTLGYSHFRHDLFEYALVLDFVDNLGIDVKGGKGLDIGGAEGTMARLMKGEDIVDHVACIEINDLQDNLPDKIFYRHLKTQKILSKVSKYVPKLEPYVVGRKADIFGHHPPRSSKFWNVKVNSPADIDEYIVDNFMERTFDEQYDFVTAFLCMEYFDIDQFFPKVFDLLSPGGVFAFIVNYWWWPVNSTEIVGDFPYAAQRLTRADLKRYFEEEYPSRVDDILQRYDYFHQGEQPILNDYVEKAIDEGFSVASTRRMTPNEDTHSKTPVTPHTIERLNPGYLSTVLSDINEFNSDVELMDLKTAYVMGIFIKPPIESKSIADWITERVSRQDHGVYFP